jgi:small ligand-binding sensory domain FIST
VSVWAIALDGEGTGPAPGASVEAFHCVAVDGPEGPTIADLPDPVGASALVLLPDPLSFPVDVALQELTAEAPLVPVLGGLASARTANGSMALFLDDEVLEGGAVGLRFTGVDVLPGVSQGAAPVGPELTVTAAEGNVILELAGRPALAALQDAIETLDTVERALVSGGLLLGIVVDSDKPEYTTGDFLVRGLLGADPASGAIALGHDVRPGQVVRLHARDAGSADRDLRSLLELQRAALGGATPAGALVFSCNGRGEAMFGARGHDAETVADELGDCPAAGFFAAGEIGPVGGEAHLHGFTAIMATFGR